MLLSSPHNPTARVWDRTVLRALAETAAETGGVLLSDEVHADLVHPGHTHPVAVDAAGDLAEHTVTLHSVGKTFNSPGVPSAFAVVPSARLRAALTSVIASHGLWEGANLLTQVVQNAALEHGAPWLDALLPRLVANRDLAVAALTRLAPAAVPTPPEASYLLWLDATALGLPADRARGLLLARCGLELQDGADSAPQAAASSGSTTRSPAADLPRHCTASPCCTPPALRSHQHTDLHRPLPPRGCPRGAHAPAQIGQRLKAHVQGTSGTVSRVKPVRPPAAEAAPVTRPPPSRR